MRPLRQIAAASLLVTATAALAQDKPWSESESFSLYEGDYTAEASSVDNRPWPWPEFMQVAPVPGQYRTKVMLVSIESPMFEELGEVDMEAIVREGFPEIHDFCVRGDEVHENWLDAMGEGECGTPEIATDGDTFTVANQCMTPDGMATNMTVDGEVSETRSRIDFLVQSDDGASGVMTMHMRAATRRTGDCS